MRIFATVSLVWIVLVASAPNLQADGWPCALYLVETHITDNGDGDGFADTNETLWIGISVVPSCDEDLHGCVARIQTDSPAIDCMRRPEIYLGDFPMAGPAVESTETFEIKMGDIDRDDLGLAPDDPLVARLTVRWDCEESVSVSLNDNEIELSLDLNLSDTGQTPVSWFEGFEDGDLGSFAAQNNDAGLPGANDEEGLANADGWRCQYTDPDWINSETYGRDDCYPGMSLAQADAVFWQLDGADVAASPDGGRAKTGSHSMYYGFFIDQPATDLFTTPKSTVEAAGMTDPVNLGTEGPRLSFWHQLSLIDYRRFGITEKTTIDRALVQIQLTDRADTQPEPWTNLTPTVNTYIPWVASNLLSCVFDPIDDRNTEDDFWDPTDPNRNRGPSSTCADQAVWSWQGDTSPEPFDVGNVGHAMTPPAPSDAPSLGSGTWVRTAVDLTPFRGRRARLRFLVSAFKDSISSEVWHIGVGHNEKDDGWWIDDILIDETMLEPAIFSNDEFLLGSCAGNGEPCIGQCRLSLAPCSSTSPCSEGEGDCLSPCPPGDLCSGPPPDCGANCSQARMNVWVEPDGPINPAGVTTGAPNEIVRLSFAAGYNAETGAEPSWVDVCIDGFREYRKCKSGDPDGSGPELPDADCDDAWDWHIYNWDPRSSTLLGPKVVTTYALEVRCSSAPDCRDGRTFEIYVECPNRNPNTLGLREIRALDRQTLAWQGVLDIDWIRGSFTTGAEIGDYVEDFTDSTTAVTSIPMDGDPPAGSGYYYLVKADGPTFPFQVYNCDTVTWRSGGDAEKNEPARNHAFGNSE
jgi:hypothetical protein